MIQLFSTPRPSRPSLWYLVNCFLFGFAGYISAKHVPSLMEHFRPANGGLLPVPFLSIKLVAWWPVYVSLFLFLCFLISAFRIEAHSATAIKIVSLTLVFFLLLCVAQLLMALALAGGML
jgi:hypothetical protein